MHFVMGNDEHSQNVFRKAKELGEEPLAYCDRMAREFLDVWRRLDVSFDDFIRTTEPRHRAGVQELVRRISAAGDIYEGFYEGWYCVSCEAFKQEKDLVDGNCPIHRTKPDWIREKNHFFRLSKYRDPLLAHLRGASRVPRAGHPAERDPAAARGGPRGHLGQPRRAVLGHPDAARSVERGLRLVRRADQLHQRGRAWHRRRAAREVVAGRPARHRQGHHAVPRGDLAGDADERGCRAAAAGLRARVGASQGRADEQVARDGGRSARRARPVRARSRCGCTWSRRSPSAATATSPGSGSRTATTSIWRTISATS